MRDEALLSWHDGARAATFEFFEPVSDEPIRRWAGSFGRSASRTTSLGVMASIDGDEMSVESLPLREGRHMAPRRQMVTDLLWRFAIEDSVVELPLTFTVVADDRIIVVDETPVLFEGVRVEGATRWVGTAAHRDVTIRIFASGAHEFSLRRCTDWETLPEAEPM